MIYIVHISGKEVRYINRERAERVARQNCTLVEYRVKIVR